MTEEFSLYESMLSIRIAQGLRALRRERGLSFKKLKNALADECGVEIAEATLKYYEATKGSRFGANLKMSSEYARCLARFYGVSTDYILGTSDEPSTAPVERSVYDEIGLSSQALGVMRRMRELSPSVVDAFNRFMVDYGAQFFQQLFTIRAISEVEASRIEGMKEKSSLEVAKKYRELYSFLAEFQMLISEIVESSGFNDVIKNLKAIEQDCTNQELAEGKYKFDSGILFRATPSIISAGGANHEQE